MTSRIYWGTSKRRPSNHRQELYEPSKIQFLGINGSGKASLRRRSESSDSNLRNQNQNLKMNFLMPQNQKHKNQRPASPKHVTSAKLCVNSVLESRIRVLFQKETNSKASRKCRNWRHDWNLDYTRLWNK